MSEQYTKEEALKAAGYQGLPPDVQGILLAYAARLEQDERAVPVAIPGWKWMRHPTWNDGKPIPVQMIEEDGVLYYCPFDAGRAIDLEWEARDPAWEEIHPAPAAQGVADEAILRTALARIANMQDRDGNLVEMHRDELRGIAKAALAAAPQPPAQPQEQGKLTLTFEFGDGAKGDVTVYGSERDLKRLAARAAYWERQSGAEVVGQPQEQAEADRRDAERLKLIADVRGHLVNVVRAFGETACANYIDNWHKPESIDAAIAAQKEV